MKGEWVRTGAWMFRRVGAGCGRAAVVWLASVCAAPVCLAGSYTNSATGNWDADASWTGAKPVAGGASDAVIVFSPAGMDVSTNNLAGTFSLNRLEFASGTVTVSGNAFSFNNNGATGPTVVNASGNAAVIKNNMVLAGETTFGAASDITVSGAVSGSGALVKTGAGNLTLATNRTYTGSTTVSAGTLTINTVTNSASMSSTNFLIQGGATMRVLAGPSVNGLNPPSTAVFTLQTNATLFSDVPTIHCGTLNAATGATVDGQFANGGCLSLHATDSGSQVVASLGALTFKRLILEPYSVVNPTQTVRYDGTGAGLTIGTTSANPFSWRPGSSSGLYTFVMDVADSPSSSVDLLVPYLNLRPGSGGIAFLKKGAGVMQLGNVEWLVAPTPVKPTGCVVSEGTLVLTAGQTNSYGVNFASVSVASGATLQVGAGGTAGAIYTNVAVEGTLAFSRSDAYAFDKVVSGSGAVNQKGPGTLTLTGANTYGGGTVVSGGTLLVGSGTPTGSGAVSVTGGTFGGTGTVSGAVSVGPGGALMPGASNAVGTLVLSDSGAGALTLNGATLFADVSNVAGVCDRVDVSGALVLEGDNALALSFPNGAVPAGTYTLMTYASRSGSGTLVLNPPYQNAVLTVGDTNAVLTVSGSGIASLKWSGSASATWDTTALNWLREGVACAFAPGDAVVFDDSATGNFTIGSAGEMTPFSVTFNNTSNYTLSAGIGGADTRLVKSGSGVATLSGSNTYGGGTTLNAGTLSIGSAENLPAGGALTFSGGSLQVTGTAVSSLDAYAVNWGSFNGGFNIGALANTLTVTNVIGGSGGLTKTGAGSVALSGINTYSGGTTVSSGYLRLNSSRALGAGPVNMTGMNCELDLTGGLVVTNAITLRGVGVVNSAGSLQSASGTTNVWSGPVTLGENQARIGAIGGTLEISGVIGSGTNKFDLVVRNPNDFGGTLLLSNNNTWQGNTWVRCGTIKLGVNDALPLLTVVQLGLNAGQTGVTNAALDLAGFSQRIAGLTDAGSDNAHLVTNSAATASTLTVSNTTAYTFAGVLSGNLNLVKIGAGTQSLSGLNASFGSVVVSNGTLAVSGAGSLGDSCTNIVVAGGTLALSNALSVADAACVRIANGGGAKVSVAAGVNESVGFLFFDDKQKPGGTYGGTGSGAAVIDPEHFSGTGLLTVLHGTRGTLLTLR